MSVVKIQDRVRATRGRRFDVLGLGECMVELFADRPLSRADTLRRAHGGDVLNTLATATTLGLSTSFVSRIGDDPFGPGLRDEFVTRGIDMSHCPVVAGENGVYFISLLPDGEREFTYRRRGSAASFLSPEDVERHHIASSRIVLLSGISQAISRSAQEATLEAARIGNESGCLVSFDVNHRSALWALRGGRQAAESALSEVLPYIDILIASAPNDLAPFPEGRDSLPRILRGGPCLVVLKLGRDGAHVYSSEREWQVPAPDPTSLVDTTGAGDAWNAGFFHALLAEQDMDSAISGAHVVAARALEHRGALPPLGR